MLQSHSAASMCRVGPLRSSAHRLQHMYCTAHFSLKHLLCCILQTADCDSQEHARFPIKLHDSCELSALQHKVLQHCAGVSRPQSASSAAQVQAERSVHFSVKPTLAPAPLVTPGLESEVESQIKAEVGGARDAATVLSTDAELREAFWQCPCTAQQVATFTARVLLAKLTAPSVTAAAQQALALEALQGLCELFTLDTSTISEVAEVRLLHSCTAPPQQISSLH